jgi:hypothetical protein
MIQSDADALQQLSRSFWNSEIWRIALNVQHRFEEGYEPSDMDSLRLDLRQLLPDSSRTRHRQMGSVWIDVGSCGLRLEKADEVVVASGDSSEKVLARFKEIVGRTLVSIYITSRGGDTDFVLDGGVRLRCFPATCQCGNSWGISLAEDASRITDT